MAIQLPIKQGDSFILDAVVKIDNVVQDITLWTIESDLKQGTVFTDTFVVTKTDAVNGKYRLTKMDTSLWPTKTISCDVQYTLPSGQVISTETFEIPCTAGITS